MQKPYDHTRYAGNQGDLWKHAGMLAVLSRMLAQHAGDAFVYGETHAGPGGVALPAAGEWQRGVGRLLKLAGDDEAGSLRGAVAFLRKTGVYPGSWRLAAECLAERAPGPWSLRLCELDPATFAVARQVRDGAAHPERTALQQTDGFAALVGLDGNPGELAACDFVLVDPPYTQAVDHPHDWERVHRVVDVCQERGIACLVWYPVFWINNPQRLVDATGQPGFELIWSELAGSRPGYASKGAGLVACGPATAHLENAAAELAAMAALLGGRLTRREPGTPTG